MRSPWPLFALLAACGGSPSDSDDEETADQNISGTVQHIAPGIERQRQAQAAAKSAVEIQRASLHLGNAYWLARLSFLAYEVPAYGGTLPDGLKAMGFPTNEYRRFENTCSGAMAYYFSGSGYSVLVYRGSQHLKDWLANLDYKKYPWWGGGFVHGGFFEQFDSLWSADPDCGVHEGIGTVLAARHRIDPRTHTAPGGELYITGHSLGGALAGITLAQLQAEVCGIDPMCNDAPNVPTSALYTFGSPKFGDMIMATVTAERARGKTPIYRFVNRDDFVTGIPRDIDAVDLLTGEFQHLAYLGELEHIFQVWLNDKTLEVSSFVLHVLDPINVMEEHMGYLPPLDYQAKAFHHMH